MMVHDESEKDDGIIFEINMDEDEGSLEPSTKKRLASFRGKDIKESIENKKMLKKLKKYLLFSK